MRNTLHTLIGILACAALLSSCSSSNDVVSHNGIQKRKYRSGFHLNGAKKASKMAKAKEDDHRRDAVAEIAPNEAPTDDKLDSPAANDAVESLELNSAPTAKWWSKSTDEGQEQRDSVSGKTENEALAQRDVPRVIQRKMKRMQKHQSRAAQRLFEKAATPIEPSDDPERDAIVSIGIALGWCLLLWFIPLINVAAGIVGIIFGIKANRGGEEGLGILGIIANAVELVLSLLWTLYVIFVIALFFTF